MDPYIIHIHQRQRQPLRRKDNKYMDPYISVIFPAYNEAARIEKALITTAEYFMCHFPVNISDEKIEIIVVLNGCTDNTRQVATKTFLEIARRPYNNLTLKIETSKPGKGAAVRRGMLMARGDIVLVTDVDLSTPLDELPRFIKRVEFVDCEVVIGSRAMPGASVSGKNKLRVLASSVFNWLFVQPLILGIPDSQCGFKVYTNWAARELAKRATLDGYALDVELLHIARALDIYIDQQPVKWVHDDNSKVHILRDSARMAKDALKIMYNAITGRYTWRYTDNGQR